MHRKVLMTSAHVYVMHLAIVDFLFLMNIPFAIYQKLNQLGHVWEFGRFLCFVHRSAHTVAFIISVGLLTLLAIDRYFVLVKNAWRNVRTKQRPPSFAHMSVAIVWILSIMLAMPNLIATEYEIDENDFAVCSENWEKIWKSAENLDLCQSNSFVFENDYENMSSSGFGSEAASDEIYFQVS